MTHVREVSLGPDVVAFGDINADIIAHFAQYPPKGEDSIADSTEIHFGGSAANTAVALARMGLATRLIARVGSDPWAERAGRFLASEGVDLACLQQDPTAMTGLMYIIVTPDGERTILGNRGANMYTNPAEINEEQIHNARLFHLSGYSLLAEPQRSAALLALRIARRHGLTISVDPGTTVPRTALEQVRSLLPAPHILLPNLAEAQQLTGRTEPEDCAQALLDGGIQAIAVKLGPDGCLVGSRYGLVRVPPVSVPARDSTGAGDSFAAGFIAGHLAGLNWESAGILGNALGARAAGLGGAGTAGLHAREVLALLCEHRSRLGDSASMDGIERAIEFVTSLVEGPEEETPS